MQSHLCQLGVKDLEEIAETLGCSDDDTKEKNRRGLVKVDRKTARRHIERYKGS